MTAEEEIRAIEQRRYQAMINVDLGELEAIIADEFVYTHASSKVDSKRSYIDGFATGKWQYRKIERLSEHIVVDGDCGLMTGHVLITVGASPATQRTVNSRFLAVWLERQGQWRMYAWQATPIPIE